MYEQLPLYYLAGFYGEIQKNIREGLISEMMVQEINLIVQVAFSRNISEKELEVIYESVVKPTMNKQENQLT